MTHQLGELSVVPELTLPPAGDDCRMDFRLIRDFGYFRRSEVGVNALPKLVWNEGALREAVRLRLDPVFRAQL